MSSIVARIYYHKVFWLAIAAFVGRVSPRKSNNENLEYGITRSRQGYY
ncbi:MAG: hypothetical protein F6K40_21380 [Okeania sp. SIO3I5]|nr:hypothetical protein [Okeania sp. SIO3I5]NEQ38682.1 hypothetical protein [Okeania sp. SIO3I5]